MTQKHAKKAVIIGVQGPRLSAEEKALFSEKQPLGFILFDRNIETATQLSALCDELRQSVGWHAPILIDQEGGRVARLREPLAPESRDFLFFGSLFKNDPVLAQKLLRLNTEMQASYLKEFGINVNCSPVLDLYFEKAHQVIGNRAFSDDLNITTKCAEIVSKTFLEYGITPIAKHMPGHGRAMLDSHEALPVLETDKQTLWESDFKPFKELLNKPILKEAVWGMVAHIIYTAYDAERPATLSKQLTDQLLREEISYDGLLVADDIEMKALKGSLRERVESPLKAGMDVILACNYSLKDNQEILSYECELSEKAWQRFTKSEAIRMAANKEARDARDLEREIKALIADNDLTYAA